MGCGGEYPTGPCICNRADASARSAESLLVLWKGDINLLFLFWSCLTKVINRVAYKIFSTLFSTVQSVYGTFKSTYVLQFNINLPTVCAFLMPTLTVVIKIFWLLYHKFIKHPTKTDNIFKSGLFHLISCRLKNIPVPSTHASSAFFSHI